MPISVTCSQCGKVLQARESAAGKRSTCPGCGCVLTIPELNEGYLSAPESAASDLFAGVEDQATDAERKPCPMCGELIAKGAVKCRFCNEILDPAQRLRPRPQAGLPSSTDDDELTVLDWVVAVFCPCLACLMGVIYLLQAKTSGAKLIGLSIVLPILWCLVAGMLSAIFEGLMRGV